jgi:hypothetical protein
LLPLVDSLGTVRAFGAPQTLRDELLCVFRFQAEALRDLGDAATVEVAKAQDFLAARREALQRFARRKLVGERVDDAQRSGTRNFLTETPRRKSNWSS